MHKHECNIVVNIHVRPVHSPLSFVDTVALAVVVVVADAGIGLTYYNSKTVMPSLHQQQQQQHP